MTDGPPGLTRYSLVVLRRPADAPDFLDDELERIQERHLAHLAAMRERGALLASGPFDDQADPSLRGLCVYGTTLDEARELASRDPAVRAGRLVADVLGWWTQPGVVQGAARPEEGFGGTPLVVGARGASSVRGRHSRCFVKPS